MFFGTLLTLPSLLPKEWADELGEFEPSENNNAEKPEGDEENPDDNQSQIQITQPQQQRVATPPLVQPLQQLKTSQSIPHQRPVITLLSASAPAPASASAPKTTQTPSNPQYVLDDDDELQLLREFDAPEPKNETPRRIESNDNEDDVSHISLIGNTNFSRSSTYRATRTSG